MLVEHALPPWAVQKGNTVSSDILTVDGIHESNSFCKATGQTVTSSDQLLCPAAIYITQRVKQIDEFQLPHFWGESGQRIYLRDSFGVITHNA